jgi:hypothetical protein
LIWESLWPSAHTPNSGLLYLIVVVIGSTSRSDAKSG